MQRVLSFASSAQIKAYCSLVKPGIIFGNVVTAIGGFGLASRGHFNIGMFFITLLGLSLIIASGCTFNNYIDRNADQKMARTQNRALAIGKIAPQSALVFASILGLSGAFLLAFCINFLTVGVALFGWVVYVALYSFLKYRTSSGTLIGSIAGATPPVIGYCAVSNQLDLSAFLLFVMIVLWQMPHFYAIALYRLEEYAAALIPVLPVKEGIRKTKIHMLLYTAAFLVSALSLTFFGLTGMVYFWLAAALGIGWLLYAIKGFKAPNDRIWARKMFLFSLVIVTTLCGIIPFSFG